MRIKKLFEQIFQRKFSNNTTAQETNQAVSTPASAPVSEYPEGTTLGDIRSELLSQMQNGCFVIPDGVTEIPQCFLDGHAYMREKDADRIVSVFVPGTVRHIGVRAFADCKNLETIILSEGIESIDDNVFTGCEKLKEIHLPASIKKITGWTFYGSGLNKPVFSADGKVLIYYPQAWENSEYAVPEGVEEIGNRSFIYAKQLTKLTLPQSLRRICSMAFVQCSFTEIAVPDKTVIENNAFFHFKHHIKIHRDNELNALEQKMEYYRVMGVPFLYGQRKKVPEKQYWKEENFCNLAKQCSMGSVDAMEKMGDYFQAKANADNSDSFYQCAAYFWRVRAYQYGSAAAKQYLIDWCREHPDSRMISPGLDEKLNGVASGELLNALGFSFFQEDREYSLSGVDAQGVVEVSSWESTEGPDEDGFGMEECYDWWYLNEYLMLPEGIGYIHSYSHNDKRCNEKKFLALHDQVAAMNKA